MVITELKETCPRCRGTGHQPGFSALGINQINYSGRCPVCAGRGFRLTEKGEDLLRLLRPFLEEVVDERLAARPAMGRPAAEAPEEEPE